MIALSTIIPVLNDNEVLRRCLAALRLCNCADEIEILVADSGASEKARLLSNEFGAIYVDCPRGRARQMNRAASLARGHWLWFLHADCIPAADSLSALLSLDKRTVWGCFRHRIDAPSPWLRIIETADTLRARLVSLPYGDQGIFVRAAAFSALGGYEDVPLLEDVLLARKLAQFGAPRILKPILQTDARRWLEKGILKTTLTNWRILFQFILAGKSPQELAEHYQR